MILKSLGRPEEAEKLSSEALAGLRRLWATLSLELPGFGPRYFHDADALRIFDLIVPYTAGRFTKGQFRDR